MVQEFSARQKKAAPAGSWIDKVLPLLSTVTMLMTLPQIFTIWVDHEVKGVSLLSWGAYLVAACFWFVHGLQQHDKAIYLACVGWVLLDAAVVVGVLVYR
jgi:uncharacterized protein with PQ loop repeat